MNAPMFELDRMVFGFLGQRPSFDVLGNLLWAFELQFGFSGTSGALQADDYELAFIKTHWFMVEAWVLDYLIAEGF